MLPPLTLDELKTNLYNIQLASTSDQEKLRDSLVIDYYGKCLYHKKDLTGILWKSVSYFTERIGYGVKNEMNSVVNNIKDSFQAYAKEAHNNYDQYKFYLLTQYQKAIESGNTSQEKSQSNEEKTVKIYEEMRVFLIRWLSAVGPFLYGIAKNEVMREKVSELFGSEVVDGFLKERQLRIDRCSGLLTLEYKSKQNIPVKALAAMSCHSKGFVGSNEIELTMKGWIERVNQLQGEWSVRLFGNALREFIKYIGGVGRIDWLVVNLSARGCRLLDEKDSKHILKYQDAEKLSQYVKQKLTEVPGSPTGRFKTFKIENNSKAVIVVGSNKLDLLQRYSTPAFGFEPIKVIEMNPGHRWAMVEKMSLPLNKHIFKYDEGIPDGEDRRILRVIAAQIIHLQTACKNITNPVKHPIHHITSSDQEKDYGIDIQDLMINTVGTEVTEIKAVKLYVKEEKGKGFNFPAWERFCFRLSQQVEENSTARYSQGVFHYLMRVSKLYEHEAAVYLRSVMKNSLDDTQQIGDLPKEYSWEYVKIRAVKLKLEAIEKRDEIYSAIIAKNSQFGKDKEYTLKEISRKIIQYVDRSGFSGEWPPGIQEWVFKAVLKNADMKEDIAWSSYLWTYQKEYNLLVKDQVTTQ